MPELQLWERPCFAASFKLNFNSATSGQAVITDIPPRIGTTSGGMYDVRCRSSVLTRNTMVTASMVILLCDLRSGCKADNYCIRYFAISRAVSVILLLSRIRSRSSRFRGRMGTCGSFSRNSCPHSVSPRPAGRRRLVCPRHHPSPRARHRPSPRRIPWTCRRACRALPPDPPPPPGRGGRGRGSDGPRPPPPPPARNPPATAAPA